MLTQQAEAVVLLTAVLGKRSADSPKPLSISEWADLAKMLQSRQMRPADLLEGHGEPLICDWQHRSITVDRVRRLLDRGTALALCLEKWERSGLWLLVRSDADYPRQLKRHLEWKSPPLLFGCGSRDLLSKKGLAVVGSRHATDDDREMAAALGKAAAANGHSVVSGGAKGVDEAAMLASLSVEGTAVGVLAAGLQREATSHKWRKALVSGDLALITPFAPDTPFHAGNAMGRNRYIYCLASAATVVASKQGAGGTWNGAVENLKHRWVPLWVHDNPAPDSGNAALVAQGGHWLPDDRECLFAADAKVPAPVATPNATASGTSSDHPVGEPDAANLDHYELFLLHLARRTAQSPISMTELVKHEAVRKDQLKVWLKRGQQEGAIDEVGDQCFRFSGAVEDDMQQLSLPMADATAGTT